MTTRTAPTAAARDRMPGPARAAARPDARAADRPADAADDVTLHGRAAVRRILFGRCDEAGLARGKGVTAEAHAAKLDRIAAALSYMTPANLEVLAELTLANAQGGYRDCWPPEVAVINWGRSLQAPPFRDDRIVTSWLASVEGPPARAAGYLVPLYRFLRRRRLPPGPYDRRVILAEGDTESRRAVLYQERIERGIATSDERAWLADWLRDKAAAEAIVAQGEAARLARAMGGDDAPL